MAGFDNFTEDDWRATLAELRLLVVSAGFGAWDASMAAALDEDDEERRGARDDVLDYARSFASFLKVRSSSNLERMRRELSELVRDQKDHPVTDAVVRTNEGGRDEPLLSAESSDALLDAVTLFANAVGGESGYFDEEGTAE